MNIELKLELFTGFYGSSFESWMDDNIDQDLSELGKDLEDVTISYYMEDYAKDIFDFAKYEYLNELSFLDNIEFKELCSPREYNFTNDKIYFTCDIDVDKFKSWLIELTTNTNDIWAAIQERIKETHTSCDGFISFHSNDSKDWVKDLLKLDLEDDKTLYKLGFIVGAFIKETQSFENDGFYSFEADYLENSDRVGSYSYVID